MAGAKITMLAGTGANNTSTATSIELDGEKGVWIGSDKTISLFSGGITNNTTSAGASVEISKDHILFGTVSANNDTTAMEITPKQIVLAAGTDNISSTNITVSAGTGVQITKSKIGLAAGANNSRSAIIMDETGIIIGTGSINTSNYTGSYTSITKTGIVIGGTGTFRVNTTNFKVVPTATGDDPMFQVGSSNKIIYTGKGDLFITGGSLSAPSFKLGGFKKVTVTNENGTSYTYNDVGSVSQLYLYDSDNKKCGIISSSKDYWRQSMSNNLYIGYGKPESDMCGSITMGRYILNLQAYNGIYLDDFLHASDGIIISATRQYPSDGTKKMGEYGTGVHIWAEEKLTQLTDGNNQYKYRHEVTLYAQPRIVRYSNQKRSNFTDFNEAVTLGTWTYTTSSQAALNEIPAVSN